MTHHWWGQGQIISDKSKPVGLTVTPWYAAFVLWFIYDFYDLRIFMILGNFTNFIPTWPFSNLYFMHVISYARL